MPGFTPETPGATERPPCPRSVDAPAYLQGELSSGARRIFASHLAGCASCREEVRETAEVLGRLRTAPTPRPAEGVDLLPRILARLGDPEIPAPIGRPRLAAWASLAAVLAVAAGVSFALLGPGPRDAAKDAPAAAAGVAAPRGEVERAEGRALDWLARAQEPSGGWSASRWGGQALFDVGVTGMAMLAFLGRESGMRGGPGGFPFVPDSAPARALRFLLREQAAGGRIGPEFERTLYNHGIATVALLAALERSGDRELREPIERALLYILRARTPRGGWGYRGAAVAEPNTSITCWPLQALLLAREQGFPGLEEAIRGGFDHLARVADENGRLGYHRSGDFLYGPDALSSMGAYCAVLSRDALSLPAEVRGRLLDGVVREGASRRAGRDLYHDFFLSSSLAVLPGGRGGRRPVGAVLAIAARQVREGTEVGSWEPRDPWGAAGGRIYTTAAATLVLQAERRGQGGTARPDAGG